MEYQDNKVKIALKIVAMLLVIAGFFLLAFTYLVFAPFNGSESQFDMWSPIVSVVETDYQSDGTINDFSSDYYYYSLSFRPLSEIKSSIKTPEQMIKFRDSNFQYVSDMELHKEIEYVSSLDEFYENKWNGDCEDFAIAIAGMLDDDGYLPLTVSLEKKSTDEEKEEYNVEIIGHRIFVYTENGKYGSIGTNYKDDRQAVFDSLNELVASLNQENSKEYEYKLSSRNALKNLDKEFPNNAWIDGKGNLKN